MVFYSLIGERDVSDADAKGVLCTFIRDMMFALASLFALNIAQKCDVLKPLL